MKIIMTLLVRDEEDILKQNIDFHLSQGVDFIIVTDNLSVDSTKNILKEYEDRGKLRYIFEERDNYNQYEWVTKMARMAATEYGADWVINNDADEFWWPNKSTIRETLSSLSDDINVVVAHRKNLVYLGADNSGLPFYTRMIYKDLLSLNPLGGPLPPKCAHRGNAEVIVGQGNHQIDGIGELNIAMDLIEILHFPIRTEGQLVNKIVKGGAAYSRNNELPYGIGRTWRELYSNYQSSGNLDKYIKSQSYDNAKLNQEIKSGNLVQDTRLKDYMTNLYV
jgi:Glycosyl transferase family 2